MLDQLEKPHSLVSNWSDLKGLLRTYGPPSLQGLREESIRKFEAVGFPTHKSEEFKYTSLRALQETPLKPAYGAIVAKNDWRKTPIGRLEAANLVFVNGEYTPELSDVQGLPEGVILMPLQEALEVDQDLVMKHLAQIATLEGRLGTTNDERFVWLNNAYLGEGVFLYVPKGVVVETPIHLVFISKADHGAFAAFPRVLIVAEENAQVKVVETYQGMEGTYFNCALTELWLGKHANVEHTRNQFESPTAFHIATMHAYQESGSTWTSTSCQFGGAIGRLDVNAFVNGQHCETWLNGVYMGHNDQILDTHTRIDHAQPNCNSFEVYKGIMDDRAKGIFNGKIFVYQDAQKTDAKQTNQALLLSKNATIDTKPQLEIFADDVKCTHGATIGQLSKEMLFYLRTRGIPEKEARGILVYAFAAAALEKVSIDTVKTALEKALRAKLQTRGGL
jgi:Fe-S cluster assembly protein SufD